MLYILSTSETKIAGYKFPFSLLYLFIYLFFRGCVFMDKDAFVFYKVLIRCYITSELNIM